MNKKKRHEEYYERREEKSKMKKSQNDDKKIREIKGRHNPAVRSKTSTAGITLIALVITIIVLLILAGVSIAMLTGENGVLTQSTLAKENTRAGTIQEKKDLWKTEQKINNYITNPNRMNKEEFLNHLKEEGLLSQEEITTILKEGKIIIGDMVITFEEELLSNEVKIGDYVEYKPDNQTYTSLASKNGVKDQTFTSNDSIKWKVLDIQNEKVILISENAIQSDAKEDYALKGKTGYLNGVEELNAICNIYGGMKAESARSINSEDIIDRICNMQEYTIKKSIFDTTPYTGDFFDGKGNPATKIDRNYSYYILTYRVMNTNSPSFNVLFLDTNGENKPEYWIATQNFNGNESGAWYGINWAIYDTTTSSIGHMIGGNHLYRADGQIVERVTGIRPIVTLKADTITQGKNEAGNWKIKE